MRSKLSVLGLFNYDNEIFAQLQLPNGMDRDTVVNSILIECADMEILYPVPSILKTAIGLWSSSMLPSWQRMLRAITEEYNPIHNYDRNEEWMDNSSGSTEVAGFDTGTMTPKDGGQSESEHTGHIYGNIGVTTSAAMVNEEVALRQRLSMVELIVNEFKSRFCLLVY